MLIWLIVLRETVLDLLQFSYIIGLAQTFFFQTLNYVNRSFLECLIDLLEFLGLCWLYRTQYYFSKKIEENDTNPDEKQITFETLASNERMVSEQIEDITNTPKNFRGRKVAAINQKSNLKA